MKDSSASQMPLPHCAFADVSDFVESSESEQLAVPSATSAQSAVNQSFRVFMRYLQADASRGRVIKIPSANDGPVWGQAQFIRLRTKFTVFKVHD